MASDRLTVSELAHLTKWPAVLCVLGLLIHSLYPDRWPFAATVAMFGDALAVGAVIAFTLEAFLSHLHTAHC